MDDLLIPGHLLEKWAEEAVTKGRARGWLSSKIHDYLIENLKEDTVFQIDGQTYKPKKYAEMVARTALREAQTKATLESCRQYENDLVEVSIHPTDCEICRVFEGRIFSISGTHPTYPKLEKKPPFHLGCRHSILPTSEAAIEVRNEYGESDLRRQIREARGREAEEARKTK